MVRMNLAPPNSQIVANTNLSDNHVAATVVRQKEVVDDAPDRAGRRARDRHDEPEQGRSAARRRAHEGDEQRRDRHPRFHDAAASPGDSTLDLLPFFPTQAFQTGVDAVHAGRRAGGRHSLVRQRPRGDTSRLQTINTPNWRSSENRVTVTFNDFVQDIETWGDCKRAKPSPCK